MKPLQIALKDFPQNDTANQASIRLTGDQPWFELYREIRRWAEPVPAKSIPGVYTYFNRYQASVYVRGRQITVAVGDIHACIRFGDAAKLWFWDYRKRPSREAVDTDFNLGIAQAQSDTKNCAWLSAHLQKLETGLIVEGFLEPGFKRVQLFDRQTFLVSWKEFQANANLFVGQLRSFPGVKAHVDTIVEALATLEKTVESADRQFVKPSSAEVM